MDQKRILIFVHDGRGLGHLRRLSRLAEQLQGNASVLFVTGHRDASYMVPKGCEYVHIPSLDSIDRKRSRQWGRSPFLANDIQRGRAIRSEVLSACLNTYQPHGFISDYLPLGMDHELLPMLGSTPHCRKYFVIRGILGDPDTIPFTVLNQPALTALRSHYDMILATCDERIVDVAQEYSFSPDLVKKLVYTGYAIAPYDADTCDVIRRDRQIPDGIPWVVCSTGGGKDGEDLIQRCWEIALNFPECYFDLIVGPRSRLSLLQEGWYGGTRIRVRQSDEATMPQRLGAADIVICRGGYNSLMEAGVGNSHILVVPIRTDFEQVHHARRLSAFRPLHIVDDLNELDVVFESVLSLPRTPHQLSELRLNGLAAAARLILADLAQSDRDLSHSSVVDFAQQRSLQ